MQKCILSIFSLFMMLAPLSMSAQDATKTVESTVAQVADAAPVVEAPKSAEDLKKEADAAAATAAARAEKSAAYKEHDAIDVVWTLVAACLVFFMQAGFGMVEAGFTRAKNAVNIMMKNFIDMSVGSLAFFFIGFTLMFSHSNGYIGDLDLMMLGETKGNDWGFVFFFFQTVFAATAATIVSGAVAGRTKFTAYIIASIVICGFIYPVFGAGAWGALLDGDGWLEGKGFYDFAGSTVVHSVGGWLALAGAIVVGPRIGKYGPDGKPRAIMGHNIPFASICVLILWLGWFGFNAGSTTTAGSNTGLICVTTCLAAAAGTLSAMFISWIVGKKPDASMTVNGTLAGLVSITAGCDAISPGYAIVAGAVGGLLVFCSVIFIDRVLKVDDPVGAISVHGVCGVWGTLAVGIFADNPDITVMTQLMGAGAAFVWAFGTGMILFLALKYTVGVRVHEDEELRGLDISEHGMEAYNGFQIFHNK